MYSMYVCVFAEVLKENKLRISNFLKQKTYGSNKIFLSVYVGVFKSNTI